MSRAAKRGGTLILVLCLLGALAWLVAACTSGSSTTTTGSPGSSSTAASGTNSSGGTSTTSASNTKRVVVGGKTPQQYAADLPGLEKAVSANPTDLTALQNLAVAQYNTGDYAGAATTYQKMLKIKDEPLTHNNYGNVLRDWKKLDQAKAEYQKAIASDPTLAIAYINLATVDANAGDLAGANKVIDQGIAATSGDGQTQLKTLRQDLNGTSTT